MTDSPYHLQSFFNQSVASKTFPIKLKKKKNAKITPIHKTFPNTDPQNYRPISELSSLL